MWYITSLLLERHSPWRSLFSCFVDSASLELDTGRYYGLLSTQELGWELARRGQTLARSLTIWCVVSTAGLISAHSLLVLPPLAPAQQTAYGIAILLLLMGIGICSDYLQIQRWKQALSKREHSASTQEKEG